MQNLMSNNLVRNGITIVAALVALTIIGKAIPANPLDWGKLLLGIVGLGSYAHSGLRNFVVANVKFVGQPRQALWLASAVGVMALTSLYGMLLATVAVAGVFFWTNRAEFDAVRTAASAGVANIRDRVGR